MKLNEIIAKLEAIRDAENAGEKEVVLDLDSGTREPRVATACDSILIY